MSSVVVTTNYQMGSLSTLELMLEELQQAEELKKELPPLPVRPVTKVRLPKGRSPLKRFDQEKKKENVEESRGEEDGFSLVQWDTRTEKDKICLMVDRIEETGLNGVVGIQRCFRGYQARRYYHELKTGVLTLQSFVRGEIARKYYQGLNRKLSAITVIQKHIKEHHHKRMKQQLAAVICLQSGIRGWLTRKQIGHGKPTCGQNFRKRNDIDEKEKETKVPCSVVLDLQRHILITEATIERKREENAALRSRIHQYEKRWIQYESQMKAMEKMWQDQLMSIQTSLAAERRKHGNPRTVGKLRLLLQQDQDQDQNADNRPLSPRTTALQSSALNRFDDIRDIQQPNGIVNSKDQHNNHHVMDMVNHFQKCIDDPRKAGQEASTHGADDELHKLKSRFKAWKKEYKNKLREVKATVKQRGHSERGKGPKIWCGR